MEHWTSDGGFTSDLSVDAADYELVSRSGSDKWALLKEIGVLGGSAWLAGFLLSAWSASRTVEDPKKGMPQLDIGITNVGIDWIFAGLGILGGLFLGDYVSPFTQTAMIGAGIGALTVTSIRYGAVVGTAMASGEWKVKGLIDNAVSSVRGLIGIGAHQDRTANLSSEAQSVLAEYEGK
jgi:hypothetical protein